MIPFIDIHTHFRRNNPDTISVLNISQNDTCFPLLENNFVAPAPFFSLGLHPWFLTEQNVGSDLGKIRPIITCDNLVFIGECGLDRLKGPNLGLQTPTFEQQIYLAQSVSKPVLIHCVKAFYEIIAIKKQLNPPIPFIIHGFNQNQTILTELLKNDFYISIGVKILNDSSNAAQALKKIPLDRLFLETDDIDFDIRTVYEKASQLRGVNVLDLKKQVAENFNRVVKNS